MEMQIAITIEKIEARVRLAQDRPDNIKAFGELWFYEEGKDSPAWKVKGFTIRLKQFGNSKNEILTVTFPAFGSAKSKTGFQTSFVFENKNLLQDVRKLFLEEYDQSSGGIHHGSLPALEDVNPDEIPF